MKIDKTDFETAYRNSLKELAQIDVLSRADVLGLEIENQSLRVLFFGSPYLVSSSAVKDLSGKKANHAVNEVICKYILTAGEKPPAGEALITFREFNGAGPLAGFFIENTQKTIESAFAGKMRELKDACRQMRGRIEESDVSFDLSVRFDALPRIPIFLRFNDWDETFPAQCSILFKESAMHYLDLKGLTILGTFLVGNLITS